MHTNIHTYEAYVRCKGTETSGNSNFYLDQNHQEHAFEARAFLITVSEENVLLSVLLILWKENSISNEWSLVFVLDKTVLEDRCDAASVCTCTSTHPM